MFQWTTATEKLSQMKGRKRAVQGSTWAGKTYSIIALEIDYSIKHPRTKTTFVAETFPAVREGCLGIFKEIMQDTGRWIESHFKANISEYKFSNGSVIQFKAFDTEGKAKAAGKRDRIFFNEGNHVPWEIAHQLIIRTNSVVWVDFNADAEFWGHTELLTSAYSEFLKLTYKDNECTDKTVLDDIAEARVKAAEGSKYWINWVKVYADGEVGSLVGAVFEDFEIVEEIPAEAELLGYGMDFGWEVPTAVTAVYKCDKRYYLDEVIYEAKLSNQDSAEILLDYGIGDALIYADSAEPKSIEEISRFGINIHACDSKQDIRDFAIRQLNNDTFYITKSSKGVIREFKTLVWGKDTKGKPTGKPKKGNDHAIDGIIYFIGTADKYDGRY